MLLLALTCFSIGCGETSPTQAANSNSAASNSLSSNANVGGDTKVSADSEESAKQQALQTFFEKHHKGWKIQGVEAPSMLFCEEKTPCNVHLVKEKQDRVITIILQKFSRADRTEYWIAYEARPLDFVQNRIRVIREEEKENTLANLAIDDIDDDLKNEIGQDYLNDMDNGSRDYESEDNGQFR